MGLYLILFVCFVISNTVSSTETYQYDEVTRIPPSVVNQEQPLSKDVSAVPIQNVGYASPCLAARGIFASANSCSKFWNCWDGVAVEQECAPGTLFNLVDNFCDFAQNVNCGNRPVGRKPSTNCDSPFAVYRNARNCSEFFQCVYYQPYKFVCYDNLYFNTDLGVCDYPYNVQCNIRPRENHPVNVIEELQKYTVNRHSLAPVETSVSCIPHAIQHLSNDCTQVAICNDNGYYRIISCPVGMLFDYQTERCVSEHITKCWY